MLNCTGDFVGEAFDMTSAVEGKAAALGVLFA
jgi:hypothetical protein